MFKTFIDANDKPIRINLDQVTCAEQGTDGFILLSVYQRYLIRQFVVKGSLEDIT